MSDRFKIMLSSALACCMVMPVLPVLATEDVMDTETNTTVGQNDTTDNAGEEGKEEYISVTFDANGGKWENGMLVETLAQNVIDGYGPIIGVPANNPIREGYIFNGWNSAKDGSGTVYTDKTVTTGDMIVYAQWRKQAPANGAWEKQADGTWKYLKPNGEYASNGLEVINNRTYFFNSKGIMQTGFVGIDGKTYFFDNSGAMKIGWLKDPKSGDWYYCTSDGVKVGWFLDAGNCYYFFPNGKMSTTWVQDGDHWYYCDSSGAMIRNRWATIKGYHYYFTSSGAMKTGWLKQDGKYYLLSDTGAMCTGWYQDPDTRDWYFLDQDGAMVTGWYTDPKTGRTYLLNDDGTMVVGWCHNTYNDEWYYFNIQAGYQVKSSWVRSEGKYFYIKADGVMARSSWIRSKKGNEYVYYYVQADGSMAVDTTIGGYHFNESGVCTNPGRD